MAESAKDLLIVGLRNAHAMESQAQELMERQIERAEFPDVKSRLQQHLDETLAQQKRLENALSMMDSSPSAIKDAALSLGANIAAMGHAMAGDEILKNTFANNAFENYEIAAYRSLITLCQEAGQSDMLGDLKQSLGEEEQMAKWVSDSIEDITRRYVRQERAA